MKCKYRFLFIRIVMICSFTAWRFWKNRIPRPPDWINVILLLGYWLCYWNDSIKELKYVCDFIFSYLQFLSCKVDITETISVCGRSISHWTNTDIHSCPIMKKSLWCYQIKGCVIEIKVIWSTFVMFVGSYQQKSFRY